VDLTAKQRLFVSYYLGVSAGNATDAARRIGCPHPEVAGHRLLRNVKVSAAIDANLDEASLTSDQILARLSEIATGGPEHFIKISSRGKATIDFGKAKKRGKMSLVKKIKQTEFGVELETHDPLRALELLAKYRGLLTGRTDIGQSNDKPTPHAISDDDPRFMASDEQPTLEGPEGPDSST